MKGAATNPVGYQAYEAVLEHKRREQYICNSSFTREKTKWELKMSSIALKAPGRAMRRVGKGEFARKLLVLETCHTYAENDCNGRKWYIACIVRKRKDGQGGIRGTQMKTQWAQ
jgi:hypothetical protein